VDFLTLVFRGFSMNPLPRKAGRVKMVESVPQTDTGGLVEYTKVNG
jgi:hypothetical protein